MANQVYIILSIIATGIGICVVVWKGIQFAAKKYLAPALQIVEDWKGDPGRPEEGIAPRDGVLKRLTRVETGQVDVRMAFEDFRAELARVKEDVAAIKKEVTANGGSSMLDRVNQTLDAVTTQNTHNTVSPIGATA